MARAVASPSDGATQNRSRTLLLLLFLGCLASATIHAEDPWFADLRAPLPGTDAEAAAAVRHVADAVFRPDAATSVLPASATADAAPRIVFVSVSDGMSRARVAWVSGAGLASALARAVERVCAFEASGSPVAWLKIELVRDVFPLPAPDASGTLGLEPGLDGLAFDAASGVAFLPDELVAHAMIDTKARLLPANFARVLARRFPAAGALDPRQPGRDAWRFGTLSFFCDARETVPLVRGHRMFAEATPAELLASARAGLRYLTAAIDEDGRFAYLYRPRTNDTAKDYNLLRHAGTIMAMLEVVDATGVQDAVPAIGRAVGWLQKQMRPAPAPAADVAVLEEGGQVKLGGAGLGIVALCRWHKATGDPAALASAVRLGRWIQSQQAESGEFPVHTRTFPAFGVDPFRSEFYPGEALLGLARLQALAPEAGPWAEVAEKGARWLIEVRDAGKTVQTLDHDHWLLYALNEWHRFRPRPQYLAHVRAIVAAMRSRQQLRPVRPDWFGAYYNRPLSTPTATCSEGHGAAWQLMRDFGTADEAREILEGLERGVRFQLQTQFRPERAMAFDDPPRCLGAFHAGLEEFEVRIDYVQHNLSAIVGLWRARGGGK